MAKYKADILDFTGELIETLRDFDSYEDAEYEAQQWISDYSAGADALQLAGRAFNDSDDIDYEIYEDT